MTHTPESLIAFEHRVAAAFEAGKIKAPIHLCSDGQAQPLIDYFREHVRPDDWVCTNWRSHFHCLLKGMSEDELFAEILAGRSMYVQSAKHRIVSSAIVGGVLPIAVGLAMGIKRNGGSERVHCFVGDMTACTGLFYETVNYVKGHGLNVGFVIENNGRSTNAITRETWGQEQPQYHWDEYKYERTYPHTGTGVYVQF